MCLIPTHYKGQLSGNALKNYFSCPQVKIDHRVHEKHQKMIKFNLRGEKNTFSRLSQMLSVYNKLEFSLSFIRK